MTDYIPAEIENPVISYNGGATWSVFDGRTGVFDLPSGEHVSFLIRGDLQARAAGSFTNTAEVQSETPDPDPSNNTDTIEVLINQSADLAVTKTPLEPAVYEGQRIQYSVEIENRGPSDAANVTLTDAVPAEIADAEFS